MSSMSNDDIRDRLIGAWELVTWQSIDEDGSVDYPLGDDAVGELVYDGSADRVSAQLVAVDQPRFASDDWQQASVEERSAAWPNYFGYFGTFTIDEQAATVTHRIASGWFPNLVGTDQVRRFRFEDDDLVLDAHTTWGRVRIVWRKLSGRGL